MDNPQPDAEGRSIPLLWVGVVQIRRRETLARRPDLLYDVGVSRLPCGEAVALSVTKFRFPNVYDL
jgi:hypothetical protein